jgi:hypothetical protein|tara:strand:+ start:1380 stop:1874 length:495 start_codon:yes stop_codon:yes gene_type:complete
MASIGNDLLVNTIFPITKKAVVINRTAMSGVRTVGGFLDWNAYGQVNTNPYDAGALKVRAGFLPDEKIQQFNIAIDTSNRPIAVGSHQDFFIKDKRYTQADWLSAQGTVASVNTDLNLNVVSYFELGNENGWVKVWNASTTIMSGTFHLNLSFPNRVGEASLLP